MQKITSVIRAGFDVNIRYPVRYTQYLCFVSVSLHISVITQDGDSALMIAVRWSRTEVVSLLLKAGANTDLQNKVKCQ